MKKKLAFVLSGGGARGALQVGAMRALLEAGYKPEILVGTSIGAANSVILGLYGVSYAGLNKLEQIYRQSAELDVLPNDYLRLMLRALFRRPASEPSQRIRNMFISNGITESLKFEDLKEAQILVVATDINHYKSVVYGLDLQDHVLEGVIASTAIPPWVVPIEIGDQLLLDGGFISNLPIEPALLVQPGEIIALDVQEFRDIPADENGFGPMFNKLVNTIQKRQFDLELEIAQTAGVPVRYIHLYAEKPVAVYRFDLWEELIQRGYEQTRREIEKWAQEPKRSWWNNLFVGKVGRSSGK